MSKSHKSKRMIPYRFLVPAKDLSKIDSISVVMGISRAEVIRQVIRHFLEKSYHIDGLKKVSK